MAGFIQDRRRGDFTMAVPARPFSFARRKGDGKAPHHIANVEDLDPPVHSPLLFRGGILIEPDRVVETRGNDVVSAHFFRY